MIFFPCSFKTGVFKLPILEGSNNTKVRVILSVLFSNNNALFGLVMQGPLQGVGILSGKLKTGSWTVTFWGVKVQTKTKQYRTVFFWNPGTTKQYDILK